MRSTFSFNSCRHLKKNIWMLHNVFFIISNALLIVELWFKLTLIFNWVDIVIRIGELVHLVDGHWSGISLHLEAHLSPRRLRNRQLFHAYTPKLSTPPWLQWQVSYYCRNPFSPSLAYFKNKLCIYFVIVKWHYISATTLFLTNASKILKLAITLFVKDTTRVIHIPSKFPHKCNLWTFLSTPLENDNFRIHEVTLACQICKRQAELKC